MTTQMINMAGMQVQIAGYYMANWVTDSAGTTCVIPGSAGGVWHNGQFSSFPPCPVPPSFQKYITDIIVLDK